MERAMQGLAAVSGKRSATGVATDDNGMTYVRNPGQVTIILTVMFTHLVLDACVDFPPMQHPVSLLAAQHSA